MEDKPRLSITVCVMSTAAIFPQHETRVATTTLVPASMVAAASSTELTHASVTVVTTIIRQSTIALSKVIIYIICRSGAFIIIKMN